MGVRWIKVGNDIWKKKEKASTLDLGTDLLSMLHYGGFVQSKIYFRVLRS